MDPQLAVNLDQCRAWREQVAFHATIGGQMLPRRSARIRLHRPELGIFSSIKAH